jgi:ornithine cyclodeaminase/alanine dehydrogenase
LKLYDRSEESASRFASTFTGKVCSLEEVSGCDVIVTMTPSREPIVKKEWLSPGTHINAMGADAPGKQELDPAILFGARVFLDDMEQGSESGEVNVPLHTGLLTKEDLAGTLGEVVAGLLPGRTDTGVTVFDSTGLAVQDLAVARVLYQKAGEKGMGLSIDLVGA